MKDVFQRLAAEWTGYRAGVHGYHADGDQVPAFGVRQIDDRRLRASVRDQGRQDRAHDPVDTAMCIRLRADWMN